MWPSYRHRPALCRIPASPSNSAPQAHADEPKASRALAQNLSRRVPSGRQGALPDRDCTPFVRPDVRRVDRVYER